MIWFWQELDPQIQVIHSFIFQAIVRYRPYILSKTKSQHEDENVENNEGDMMVEIDNPNPNPTFTKFASFWDIERKTKFKKKYS